MTEKFVLILESSEYAKSPQKRARDSDHIISSEIPGKDYSQVWGLLVTNPGVVRQALLRDVTVTEYFRRPIRMERNRHDSAKLRAIVGFSSLGNKTK